MPVYYFQAQWDEAQADVVTAELKSVAEAKAEAVRYLGEILAGQAAKLIKDGSCSVRVADATDRTMLAAEAKILLR